MTLFLSEMSNNPSPLNLHLTALSPLVPLQRLPRPQTNLANLFMQPNDISHSRFLLIFSVLNNRWSTAFLPAFIWQKCQVVPAHAQS